MTPLLSSRRSSSPGAARRRRAAPARLGGFVLVAVIGALLWSPSSVSAATGDIGYEGPSTANAGTSPTASKPESKLWWNDGHWWASMWSSAKNDYHVFRLDVGTQKWTDTGVRIDDRATTHADTLWDPAAANGAGKLYVASHKFTEKPSNGYPSRLYRYSYNASTGTYALDAGFPVVINNYRLETLVIDKDSTGRLWATWVQGGKVWVNATICDPTCNDASWGNAFQLPGAATVSADDISSLIAFGGSHIGLMWSNENAATDYFAVHNDGDADGTWAIETALAGSKAADDHIDLKTTADGRVFAAVKTSKTTATDPLTMLLVRPAGGGAWAGYRFGTVADGHTRPIVEIDEEHGVVHMFATSSSSGGSIMEKTSPIDAISFPAGSGTEVIRDASTLNVNDPTSTKQNVTSASGLVVVAHSTSRNYFHSYEDLSGGAPQPPVASFSATPDAGDAPLTVHFADTSTGGVQSREWDFQDDGTTDSTLATPQFVYATPGVYTARLTVTNGAGSDSTTATITVTEPSGGGGTMTFAPTDDTYVKLSAPNKANGADVTLRVYKTSTEDTQTYLRFVVSGVTGPVTGATLRLWVVDGSVGSGALYAVPETPWTEGTLTWNTKPDVGNLLAASKAATLGTWLEFDLSRVVSGDGTYSFALKDGPSNTAWYSSKEGADDPQLVLTVGP
jgi:PKD repeat protein